MISLDCSSLLVVLILCYGGSFLGTGAPGWFVSLDVGSSFGVPASFVLSGISSCLSSFRVHNIDKVRPPPEPSLWHEEFDGITLFQFYISISSNCFYFSLSRFGLKIWTSEVHLIDSISVPIVLGFKLPVSCLANQVALYE
ncbi:unnamed protein product [Cuscuta epithymum]|uniref:Uncharacterized protein n=1 Tax=Cuscuta epithymum TaxID=186058 RepID=A0AAV0DBC9_9ASTE|nr:unnamed protein product [Cuscuta epithymum]